MLSVDDTVMLRLANGAGQSLAVNALVLRSHEDETFLAVGAADAGVLAVGSSVEVVAYVMTGVFSADATVVGVDDNGGIVRIRVNSTVRRSQHRRFLRVSERMSVVAFRVDSGPPERLSGLGVFESADISGGGLGLAGKLPLAVGALGAFRFELRDAKYLLRGTVTRSDTDKSACQFVDVPLAVEQALVTAVNAIQRERLRPDVTV
jgi:hypothetical protein